MAKKRHVITVSGLPGSGKSSTAKALAKALEYQHFSSGDFMRHIGQARGLSVDETNKAAETDSTFDQQVDEAIRKTGEKENIVIDSRIAFHWIPDSFKVFLKLDPHFGAQRTFDQIQKVGRFAQDAQTVDEVYQKLLIRIEGERNRYIKTYEGLDYTDESHYDLIIDTAKHNLEEVVELIQDKYKEWLRH